MLPPANLLIHASQFPDRVERELLASLRRRRVNHKFHYDSIKQTQKWLALHQAFSPSRRDSGCQAIYAQGFMAAAQRIRSGGIHLIGLGCGGGQKDTRLLKLLKERGSETSYTPCDVSTAMVLVARQTALSVLPHERCFPLVCDLASTPDLAGVLDTLSPPHSARIVTFFGMIPNFEPRTVVSKLAGLLRPGDQLLFSANLAPGKDYAAGVRQILPQYDNEPTREWLLTFLQDLGVERGDGRLRFGVEDGAGSGGLKRVVANYVFSRGCRLAVGKSVFNFVKGDSIRLFFSYRLTPPGVCSLLGRHGLTVRESWIARSEEEGVFLAERNW